MQLLPQIQISQQKARAIQLVPPTQNLQQKPRNQACRAIAATKTELVTEHTN